MVEMIHPARFLFNAGCTLKQWNEQMLQDSHLKELYFEQDSRKIFSNMDIKGGVVITHYDKMKDYGTIQVLAPYMEWNSIINKATPKEESDSLMSKVTIQNKLDLEALYLDYQELKNNIGSDGKGKRFRNNIFDKIPVFSEEEENNEDIAVISVINNKRQWRYLPKKYIHTEHENLYKWKVLGGV